MAVCTKKMRPLCGEGAICLAFCCLFFCWWNKPMLSCFWCFQTFFCCHASTNWQSNLHHDCSGNDFFETKEDGLDCQLHIYIYIIYIYLTYSPCLVYQAALAPVFFLRSIQHHPKPFNFTSRGAGNPRASSRAFCRGSSWPVLSGFPVFRPQKWRGKKWSEDFQHHFWGNGPQIWGPQFWDGQLMKGFLDVGCRGCWRMEQGKGMSKACHGLACCEPCWNAKGGANIVYILCLHTRRSRLNMVQT